MAVGDIFGSLKNTVKAAYNNFFYNGRQAPSPQVQETAYPESPNQAPPQQMGGYQQPYQQNYQQAAYQQQPYQQPVYQQPAVQRSAGWGQQPAYQQPQQTQPAAQGRVRRAQMHAQRQEENVVDFGAYQQGLGRQNPPAEQPAQEAAQQTASLLSARVINARSMGDCRSAITLLRNGDAVVIVMENISDPTEMRRLVDTLSGACYSLTATITKVSRYGVYLLAPQTLAVFADQATNMMNSAPAARAQARNYQPSYTGQRVSYAPPQREAQPAQQRPQPQPYSGMQDFTQRAAEPEEARQNFYQRPAPQAAQTPAFSAQPAGYGYAPDEFQAVGEQ